MNPMFCSPVGTRRRGVSAAGEHHGREQQDDDDHDDPDGLHPSWEAGSRIFVGSGAGAGRAGGVSHADVAPRCLVSGAAMLDPSDPPARPGERLSWRSRQARSTRRALAAPGIRLLRHHTRENAPRGCLCRPHTDGRGSSLRGTHRSVAERYARPWMSVSTASWGPIAARSKAGWLLDVAIALGTFGGSLALIAHGGIGPGGAGAAGLDPVSFGLAAFSTLPLVVWRRFPLGVLTLTVAASALLAGLGYRIDLLLGPAAALYLIAASREHETPWAGRATAMVIVLLTGYLGAAAIAQTAFPGSELLHTGLAWAVAWFAGERTRLRREQITELNARAHSAEQDVEREGKLAAAEERARIARDLHDSAGHAINVIAVRAGAARLRHHQEPDRSLLALEAIEEIARQTAADIDHIVGTLRDDGTKTGLVEAPAGLVSMETLLDRYREAGLDVTSRASGIPQPLTSASDQAAYRILQEALTNAARHGEGSADIGLDFGPESVELTVTNPVAGDRPPTVVGGHGLAGMRERATLLGGTLDIRHANQAFRVRARIPYGTHSA